jgi:hypothetical protein
LERITVPPYASLFVKDPNNGIKCLDAGYPYPFGGSWLVKNLGKGYDSPQQPIFWSPNDNGGTDWRRSSASDSFETWIMYMPPSVNSRPTAWIPIASYTWAWGGSATLATGATVWTLNPGAPTGGQPAESFVHPKWQDFSPGNFGFKAK